MSDVKPGDLVRLKSGGPLMVVSHVSSQHMCSVRWFADDSMREGVVFAVALVSEPGPKPGPEQKATDEDVPRDAKGARIWVGDIVTHKDDDGSRAGRWYRVARFARYKDHDRFCVEAECGTASADWAWTVIGRAVQGNP